MPAERDVLRSALLERQRELDRAAEPKAPFPGLDKTGMPQDLARAETSVWRRLGPRRNRWPELAELDQRIAVLEQRQSRVIADIHEAERRLTDAPSEHALRLADWELQDRKGERPPSPIPAIERQLADLRADHEGLGSAIEKVLEEKVRLVERHRARLVKDADREAGAAHASLRRLLDQVANARRDLAELRQAALWASAYPHPVAGEEPPVNLVAGGLRKPAEAAGIQQQVHYDRLLDLLRADADWLRDAMTPGQKALAQGRDPHRPEPAATWAQTPEGREADRQERLAALARHRELWGTELP